MRKRNIEKHFFFNDEEASMLKIKSETSGLCESQLVRSLIKGYSPKEKPDKEFYTMMRELSAIGNRITQLAAKANALNFIDAPMLKEETIKWAKFQTAVQQKFLSPEKVSE